MNVCEVHESIMFIHMCCPGWQAMLRLLWEFQQITTSMIGWYHDLAMHKVVEIFEKDDQLHVLAQGLLWLYFIPIHPHFLHTGPRSIANGAGLPTPVNRLLDDWCQYTAHHFRPNRPNPTSGILMDTSYHVSYASIWGNAADVISSTYNSKEVLHKTLHGHHVLPTVLCRLHQFVEHGTDCRATYNNDIQGSYAVTDGLSR